MELSTIDYHYLLREWQLLVGGRIQKIYMKDRMLVLQIYSRANYTWVFDDGKSFLTQARIEYPQQPSGFTMFLRKRLQGNRITNISLYGFDRILSITVQTKEGPQQLVIELLDKVNYMLCREGNIISPFETHSYAGRTIRGGTPYAPPPSKPVPWEADLHMLTGKEAARTIAVELGLGGKYSEELCARASIDRKHPIAKEDLSRIKAHLLELRDHTLQPLHRGAEALPYPFVTKPGEWQAAASYNEAIDAVERTQLETTGTSEQQHEHKVRQTKQEKIIAAQRSQLERLNAVSAENQRKGELIYEYYSELQTLFEQLKHDWKALTFNELKEKYKDHPRIKSIEKDGTVEVEL